MGVNFEELLGKVIIKIEKINDEELRFYLSNGAMYKQCHMRDCCESVTIEDIVGDLNDLLYTKILLSEEVTQDATDNNHESATWTFYKLATIKGYVTIRWYGESNGYYSMGVSFGKMNEYGGIEY